MFIFFNLTIRLTQCLSFRKRGREYSGADSSRNWVQFSYDTSRFESKEFQVLFSSLMTDLDLVMKKTLYSLPID